MKKFLALSLGLVLIAAACNRNNDTSNQTTTPPPAVTTPTPTSATPPAASTDVIISITSSGFTPSNVTVKKGTTVTFVNDDTKTHWPASGPHPSHTDYPQFDPKQAIAPTDSWSFAFDKVGTWRFHDHLSATHFGSVIVID